MTLHSFRTAVLVSAFLSATSIPTWAADQNAAAPSANADPVVATVNGKDIHRSVVVETYNTSQFRQVPLEMVYDQVLDYVITGQLILTEAQKQGLENDPKVKEALKMAEERILQQTYLAKRIDTEVSEDAIKKRFEEVKKSTPPKEEVKARHILVASEDEAKKVLSDLKSGVKFEDEAKAKTQDPSGKENGGDLGYFSKDEMVPEFSDAAFKLKAGEVSKTPVKTQFGWHIIKVEDRRMAPPPTYEESRASLKAEMSQQAAQKIIEGLTKAAQVKRFDMNGNPLPDKAEAPDQKKTPTKK